MKLLYLQEMTWELDYLKNEILCDVENLEIEFFKKDTFKNLLERTDIVENNILALNAVCHINDIIEVVKYIKPSIIFYLSDEKGDNSKMIDLEKYTKILFRQYNFNHYNYSTNNYQIPLGYSNSFLKGRTSLATKRRKTSERIFNASFIGAKKSDRVIMSDIFKEKMKKTNINFVQNSWDITKLPFSPQDCFDKYNKSIFVICGRGNSSLDCFRVYEAIVAGAIPIVVGTNQEINITFKYNNKKPPIIYANNWEKAVIKCNSLLDKPDELQEMQSKLLEWWNNEMNIYKELIRNVLIKSD